MILLVDMDAFFASVEQAHHPHLRGQPVIVCGDPSRRGVVTAASYEARPFGVRAGMPLAEAKRLCPDAEYVEGDPRKYVEKSLELLEMFLEITPDVEPFSVDEAFLDLKRLPGRGQTLESAADSSVWPRPGSRFKSRNASSTLNGSTSGVISRNISSSSSDFSTYFRGLPSTYSAPGQSRLASASGIPARTPNGRAS